MDAMNVSLAIIRTVKKETVDIINYNTNQRRKESMSEKYKATSKLAEKLNEISLLADQITVEDKDEEVLTDSISVITNELWELCILFRKLKG